MTAKEARKLYGETGNLKKAAKVACMRDSVFRKLVKGELDRVDRKVVKKKVVSESKTKEKGDGKKDESVLKGRSMTDFRALYDKDVIVPTKVKGGLSALGGSWLYEVEFAKAVKVSLYDLGKYRDKFARHVVQVRDGRKVWVGSVAMADSMREALS